MKNRVAVFIISKLLETIDVSLYRRLFITFSYVTEFLLLDVFVRHVFIYYHYLVAELLYIFLIYFTNVFVSQAIHLIVF